MVDYCSDDISTEEADELIKFLQQHLPEGISLYTGVSYRHCLVWNNASPDIGELTPPHDISGRKVTEYLPDPDKAGVLLELMKKSYDLLKDHPVNQARVARGQTPRQLHVALGAGEKGAA